jgi:hypothetical protein
MPRRIRLSAPSCADEQASLGAWTRPRRWAECGTNNALLNFGPNGAGTSEDVADFFDAFALLAYAHRRAI